jgi:hypothetical protein
MAFHNTLKIMRSEDLPKNWKKEWNQNYSKFDVQKCNNLLIKNKQLFWENIFLLCNLKNDHNFNYFLERTDLLTKPIKLSFNLLNIYS